MPSSNHTAPVPALPCKGTPATCEYHAPFVEMERAQLANDWDSYFAARLHAQAINSLYGVEDYVKHVEETQEAPRLDLQKFVDALPYVFVDDDYDDDEAEDIMDSASYGQARQEFSQLLSMNGEVTLPIGTVRYIHNDDDDRYTSWLVFTVDGYAGTYYMEGIYDNGPDFYYDTEEIGSTLRPTSPSPSSAVSRWS